MSESQWYFARGDQQQGPIPLEDLRAMIAAGQLTPGDLVWTADMPDWAAAGTLPALFPPPAAAAGSAIPIVDYHTPEMPPFRYAGFWLRVVAYFIDGLLLWIPKAILSAIALISIPVAGMFSGVVIA